MKAGPFSHVNTAPPPQEDAPQKCPCDTLCPSVVAVPPGCLPAACLPLITLYTFSFMFIYLFFSYLFSIQYFILYI